MSETQSEYKIVPKGWEYRQVEPQGEICLRYDDPEPEQSKAPDMELILNQLDGWVRELNLAIQEIQPFINQKRVTRGAMHGLKLVYPCCTKFYKTLSAMQKAAYNLRKELNDENNL